MIRDKKGTEEKRGKKVEEMYKASCHTGGNTNKKKYILVYSSALEYKKIQSSIEVSLVEKITKN